MFAFFVSFYSKAVVNSSVHREETGMERPDYPGTHKQRGSGKPTQL